MLHIFQVEQAFPVIDIQNKLESLLKAMEQSIMHSVLDESMRAHVEFKEVFFKFMGHKMQQTWSQNLQGKFADKIDTISALESAYLT